MVEEEPSLTIAKVDQPDGTAPGRWRRLKMAAIALAVPLLIAVAVIVRAGSNDGNSVLVAGGAATLDSTSSPDVTASSLPMSATTEASPPQDIDTNVGPAPSLIVPAQAVPATCSLLAPWGSFGADATCQRGLALQSEVDWFACLNEQGLPAGADQPDPMAVSPPVATAGEAACRALRPPMALMIIGPYGSCMREHGQFFISGVLVEGFSQARQLCRSQLPPPPFPASTLAYHACLSDAGYDVNGPLPGDPPPSGPPTLDTPRAAGEACRHLMVGLSGAPPDDYVNCLADHGIFEMIPGPRWHGPEPQSMTALRTCGP